MLWILQIYILYLFYSIIPYIQSYGSKKEMYIITLFLYYNIFSFIRGAVISENYWDYKALINNGLALFLPVVSFAGTSTTFLKILIQFYLNYALPLLAICIFFISSGGVGYYLIPISFLALFLPVINKPWRIIILLLCLLVIFSSFGARSNVIKFTLPVLFSLIYYIRFPQIGKLLEFVRKGLFILPLLLFGLAIFGDFNIFKMDDYLEKGKFKSTNISVITGKSDTEDLTADTRTPLYLEVIKSAKKNNSWLIGRSPARGNETELFSSVAKITGRQERTANEVAILNIFTWTGIVGVILYFLIFYKASYLAIMKSNNIFIKIIGLFIAFRWCYAWVEDINYFTLNTFFLWITIGLCFSKPFRKMTDTEVTSWVNQIFKKQRIYKSNMH